MNRPIPVIFIDTNVFIRALAPPVTERDREMSDIAREIFRFADRGEILITSSEAVIAEVAQFLESKRGLDLQGAALSVRFRPILELKAFRSTSKRMWLQALDLCEQFSRLGFVDCLSIVYAKEGEYRLATFDKELGQNPMVRQFSRS